jgi:hypothetical protein
MYNKKVFLGGTVNGSTWRDRLINMLRIPYFNPVTNDWNYAAQINEERQKAICRYHLYVITPLMVGCFSIAEIINDSIRMPDRTLICFLKSDDGEEFSDVQWKSLLAVAKMAQLNGARFFTTLEKVAEFLNN